LTFPLIKGIQPLSRKILGKMSKVYIEIKAAHSVDAFDCQQTYLTMGTAISMGITDKSLILFEKPSGYTFFSCAFLLTFTNHNHFSH